MPASVEARTLVASLAGLPMLLLLAALGTARAQADADAPPADAPPADAPPADAPPAETPPADTAASPLPQDADALTALQARLAEAEARIDDLQLALELQPAPAPPAPPAPPPRPGLQSLNPDLSFIADVAAAWFSAEEPLQTGGHDPSVTGFNLQQLELSVQSIVDPYFSFDANLVFSLYGVEIEEVYATTRGLPGRTQLRAGQMLTRFGRVNNSHPHAWDFVDQPLAIGRIFGGEGNRGLGLEGSVLLPLPWYVELVASETMAGGASTARSFYGGQDLGVDSPLHLQSTVALKQFFPLGQDLSLAWGLSWAGGPNPTGATNRSEVYGTDLFFKIRPITAASSWYLSVQAELLHRRYQAPGDVLSDWTSYEQVVWRFDRRWAVGARHELGTATRDLAGEVVADPLDPFWTADRHRISAALTWWGTEFSRVRLQGATDLRGWQDQPEYSAFLAFEFNVGAHGAHAF